MNIISSFGRQNLAESDKGSWFNQLSDLAKQLVLHLSLNVSAVNKKKIMESRRKQCYERATSKNESGLFLVVGFFIVRNWMPPCIFETMLQYFLLGLFFFFWKLVFFLSFCPLLTTAKMCASLNPCSTCSLVCFLFWRRMSLSLRFSHSWPRLNYVCLERDCNTIAFPFC